MKIQKHSLKQARKNADIPLTTMASVLITDVSNLSKYERGVLKPTADILLAYHLITQSCIKQLYGSHLGSQVTFLSYQLSEVIEKLTLKQQTPKVEQLINRLTNSLSCIKAVDYSDHERKE